MVVNLIIPINMSSCCNAYVVFRFAVLLAMLKFESSWLIPAAILNQVTSANLSWIKMVFLPSQAEAQVLYPEGWVVTQYDEQYPKPF